MNININIYKSAREKTVFTQESVAEQLHISVESIRAYETGKRRPADDIVANMIDVYQYPYLGYQHLMSSPLCDLLPEVVPYSMEQAAMRLVRLLDKFDKNNQDDTLLEIAEDGLVSSDELEDYQNIMDELEEIMEAAMALNFFVKKQKKSPDCVRFKQSDDK